MKFWLPRKVYDFDFVLDNSFQELVRNPIDDFPEMTERAESIVTPELIDSFAQAYWRNRAINKAQLLTRALYAICTQRTQTDAANATAELVLDTPWQTMAGLRKVLVEARCGLYDRKAESAWSFTQAVANGEKLLGHPLRQMDIQSDSGYAAWVTARDRLCEIPGIGYKLASMCLHLFCPFECPLLVIDSLFARDSWYNINVSSRKQYLRAEAHWRELCKRNGWKFVSIAREVLWTCGAQGKMFEPDDEWWSYILRKEPATPLADALRDQRVWTPNIRL